MSEKDKLISLIYDIHSEWLHQVAFNFSSNRLTTQDMVQDMFVMLVEMKDISKIKYNNTVNLYYLYKTLRSIFLNKYQKHNSTHVPLAAEVDFEQLIYSEDTDNNFEDMIRIVNETLQTEIHWFDARLLDCYLNDKTKSGKNTREHLKIKLEKSGYNAKSYKQ